jgi:hypothetical protein
MRIPDQVRVSVLLVNLTVVGCCAFNFLSTTRHELFFERKTPSLGTKCPVDAQKECRLLRLDDRGRHLQLSAKDSIPEFAGDAKAQLVIKEVVGKVVLLEFLVPERQVLVVEEVVGKVVQDVAEDAARVRGCGDVPIEEEDGVGELPERRG